MRKAFVTGWLVVLTGGGSVWASVGAKTGQQDVSPNGVPSAALLSLLPDGPMKQRFILDCTGCHQLDSRVAFPSGAPRPQADWQVAAERMVGFAGDGTAFPIISPHQAPALTADFLARHLTRVPASYDYGPVGRDVEIREYAYPYGQDLPHDVAVDARGQVLITGMFTHRVLVLDPETSRYQEIPIPVPSANPRAIDIDADGNWWVLLGNPHQIARYVPAEEQWSTFDIGMYGHSIRPDLEGRVWFNGHFTRDPVRIGYVDARSGSVVTFDIPTSNVLSVRGPIPYGLRVAPNGAVWGTDLRGNRIYRLDPATKTTRQWDMPISNAGPRRPDFDARGTLWIPAYAANALVSFDPRTESFESFPMPIADALPYVVRIDHRSGRVWIGTGAADAVVAFDPTARQFRVYPLPTRGALVRHMAIDARNGDLWIAYGASPGIEPKIARLRQRV